jgi:hypothetical protein
MCGTSEARTTYTSGAYGFTPGCYVYCNTRSLLLQRITSIHAKRVWGCQNGVIRRNVIGRKGRKKTYNDLQNTTMYKLLCLY